MHFEVDNVFYSGQLDLEAESDQVKHWISDWLLVDPDFRLRKQCRVVHYTTIASILYRSRLRQMGAALTKIKSHDFRLICNSEEKMAGETKPDAPVLMKINALLQNDFTREDEIRNVAKTLVEEAIKSALLIFKAI
ncbi:hypothetical protein Ciccas_010997 [Cichlidogyrus casuarinus]|uniref:Uncharacterized protein n=1 Tax=Cichlidogyrus casuarinus TaxID=1844966 RepID=A0ABD2PSI4_9PLAT